MYIRILFFLCAGMACLLYGQMARSYPKREIAFRYFRCGSRYFLLARSDRTWRWQALASASEIDSLRDVYTRSVLERRSDHIAGFRLFELLVPPEYRNAVSRLAICGVNPIHPLPFEALVRDTCGVKPAYLVDQASIVYSPTLSYDKPEIYSLKYSGQRLLAIAPEYDLASGLMLPFAPIEVCVITQENGKDTRLCGPAATKEHFLRLAPQYHILHIAAHTQADPRHPNSYRICFANRGKPDLLTAGEIRQLHLHAQLAVLSACQTGNESAGLAQAFREAGVKNLVAAAWDVPDKSTARIIRSFYQKIYAGLPKSEALQQAKLEYLEQSDRLGSEPYFWAGMILEGDHSPVFPLSSNRNRYIRLLLSLPLFLVFYRSLESIVSMASRLP